MPASVGAPSQGAPPPTNADRQSFPPASSCSVEPLDPAVRDAWVQSMTERTDRILASSEKPEWVFLCQMASGGTLCLPPVDGRSSLLLFTSPLLALDYLRAIGAQGKVGGIHVSKITELPRGWPKLGVHSFCLNRCPRCDVALTIGFENLGTLDGFIKIWAVERASRFLKGQGLARAVLEAQRQGVAEMKVALETLRDHAAADNAHVYQLLAMVAQTQEDTQGRADALARLHEMQLPVRLETEDFARGFSEGIVGLLGSYELLRLSGPPARTM
jgi:hypothetical protein